MTAPATTVQMLMGAIHQRLRDRSVEFAFGRSELAAHAESSRIIWVPAGGRVQPANKSAFQHPSNPALTIHPLATNELRVYAYLEAEHAVALERMWVDLLTATRDTMGLASRPTNYVLDTSAERAGVSAAETARMSQTFEWQLILARSSPKALGPTLSATERAFPPTFVLAHELLLELE